jgi:Flp pilus assembly protein TadD
MSEVQRTDQFWRPAGLPDVAKGLQDSFIRLQQAEQLRQRGRLDQAQSICESLLQSHPDYAGALHTLGLVLADKENHQQALNYLVRAAMLNPRNWMTLTALSGVYLRLGAIEMAKQTIDQARSIEPREPGVLLVLGDILREEREFHLARDAYRQAVATDPSLAPAAVGLGWCLADLGEYQEAARVFETLIERGMRLLEPLRALASFPASVVRIDLLTQLEKAVREPGESEVEFDISAAFIRATALDRAGRHAEAWEHAARANRRAFQAMQGNLQRLSERRRTSLASLREHPGHGERGGKRQDAQPISLFVLGPSRSGKTTMERMISTLAGVKRGHESPIVEHAVSQTFQASALPTDSVLMNVPAPAYALCRSFYHKELARRVGTASVFTNTNSACIFEAAQIISAFENVRFILMKRNVDDNLLQIYFRKYQAGNVYSYDLKAAREHIIWYHQMIDLLAEKFPNIVRVIQYEDMIADPVAALRTAAELCGLPTHNGPPPKVAGDLGCSAPYRRFMAVELQS